MQPIVIQAEDISKQYRLGLLSGKTLSEDVKRFLYRMAGKPDPLAFVGAENDRTVASADRYVWALKNINFEVRQGEVMGIIGRNGAGKSTLLKILSRVTTPTTGEIRIKGKIASLLEVGTGFHPELTGRENVFLNGAILGMSKAEIKRKFDEIVQFSGVARYIDTPVKRYSSGMYVRLAFAVAAHLEPEILVIDEVLAVGDTEFQKKCLGKIKEVAGGGRTVLFVSHNMGAVSDICDRAIMIEKGNITSEGIADAVIREYVNSTMKTDLTSHDSLKDAQFRRGSGQVRISALSMHKRGSDEELNEFDYRSDVSFNLTFRIYEPVSELYFLLALRSSLSREMVTATERIRIPVEGKTGEIQFNITLPALNLSPGVYETYYWLGSSKQEMPYDVIDNMTAPLVIRVPENESALQTGYFQLDYKTEL
ncbi:MAG: ABC transporter ATP-binding protein [Bacteroidetes bacterium]|nr:ABC transporter ATP-binding protein [Bacteroidota bacterium]